SMRREQIVEAAVAVIAEKGLQNLSLSEIEKKAGMSRGQLTYYFAAKEDILLAVFDRMLGLMCQRHCGPDGHGGPPAWPEGFWDPPRLVLHPPLRQPAEAPGVQGFQDTLLS